MEKGTKILIGIFFSLLIIYLGFSIGYSMGYKLGKAEGHNEGRKSGKQIYYHTGLQEGYYRCQKGDTLLLDSLK